MLRSDGFAESRSNSVKLPGISEIAARTVLHALTCTNRCVDKITCLETAVQVSPDSCEVSIGSEVNYDQNPIHHHCLLFGKIVFCHDHFLSVISASN